jgi:hypothetical protein
MFSSTYISRLVFFIYIQSILKAHNLSKLQQSYSKSRLRTVLLRRFCHSNAILEEQLLRSVLS